MQLKHAILALAAAGMLSGQAYAAEAQVEGIATQPVAAFAETDLQALFEQDAAPMQLAALSEQEMKETEGALAPWVARAAIGGVTSGLRYAITNYGTPNFSWRDQARAIGYGAVGGVLSFSPNKWVAGITGTVVGSAGMRWGW